MPAAAHHAYIAQRELRQVAFTPTTLGFVHQGFGVSEYVGRSGGVLRRVSASS